MFYEPRDNDHGLPYNPFKACVVPRPIGWITTLSHDNIVNLAPFSCSNQLGYDPPFVFFSGSGVPGEEGAEPRPGSGRGYPAGDSTGLPSLILQRKGCRCDFRFLQ